MRLQRITGVEVVHSVAISRLNVGVEWVGVNIGRELEQWFLQVNVGEKVRPLGY